MKKLAVLLCTALFACDALEDSGDTDDTGSGTSIAVPDVGTLVDAGGCGDVQMLLSTSDRSAALVFSDEADLTEQAYAAGEPITATYTLPAEGILELHQGTEVTGLFCNDAFDDNMVIDHTWTATAGTVTITVTSEGIDHGYHKPADATITIEGAVLQLDGSDDVTIESVSWTYAIGWLAG